MKTLDEYNAIMHDFNIRKQKERSGAGVLCPECIQDGEEIEMYFTNPDTTLLSDPPKMGVKCPHCDYHGYKTV